MKSVVKINGIVKWHKVIKGEKSNMILYVVNVERVFPSGKKYDDRFMCKQFNVKKGAKVFENDELVEIKGSLRTESYVKEGQYVNSVYVEIENISLDI